MARTLKERLGFFWRMGIEDADNNRHGAVPWELYYKHLGNTRHKEAYRGAYGGGLHIGRLKRYKRLHQTPRQG